MKFNWKWVCQESFLLLCGIIAVILLCYGHNWDIPDVKFAYSFAAVIALACFACVFATLSIGETYYKYFMLDKKAFQSHIFENMLVLVLDDVAYTFTHKADEIHELKEIKVVEYYNIKKKQVKWRLIPYQQLDEIKAKELTEKRAAKKAEKKK